MERPKLVCFDMDDTLIEANSWYRLNLALGVTPEEDQQMYDAYGRGDLSYEGWIEKLSALYQERGQATRDRITAVLCDYTFKEGAVEVVQDLAARGYTLAILSGSIDVLVDHVADTLGIPRRKANTTFNFDGAGNFLSMVSEGDEPCAKLRHLEVFCKELGIEMNQCVCIGDGANDVELFKQTGRGITFLDAPQHVQDAAWRVVTNLTDVRDLL